MRKSNVVKAMACFMAATMAITCVPSANVANGISIVAEAGSIDNNADGSQTITGGTAWWNGQQNGKDYKLEGNSRIVLYVEAQKTGGFCVELQSAKSNGQGHGYFLTTGSNRDAWTAEDAIIDNDNHKNISGRNEGTGELVEGHTYRITVTRFDQDFTVEYYDYTEQKEYCEIRLKNSNFPTDDVNVRIIAQVGTYRVSENFIPNKCKDIVPTYDSTPAVGVPFTFTAKLTGEDTSRNVTDSITAAAINGKITTEIKKGSDANEYILSITPDKEGEGSIIVTTGSIQELNANGGKSYLPFKFEAKTNKCTDLICSKAEKVNNSTYRLKARIGEAFPFTVTAKAANQNAKLVGTFKVKTVSGSSVMDKTGLGEKEDDILYEYDNGIRKTNGNRVLDVLIKEVKAGENAFEFGFDDKTITVIVEGVTSINGTTIGGSTNTTPGTTTPGTTDTNKPADTNKPEDTNKPADTNKPEDTNKPADTNKPSDNDNNNSSDNNTNKPSTTTKKKKATVKSAKAKKGKKIVSGTIKLSSGKVVKKATVKVYVNNKKKATTKTNNKGKFSIKLSKKLKKGDKVKLVITKSTIKKITKTIKVK